MFALINLTIKKDSIYSLLVHTLFYIGVSGPNPMRAFRFPRCQPLRTGLLSSGDIERFVLPSSVKIMQLKPCWTLVKLPNAVFKQIKQ